jgi:hypothetical protein
MPVPTYDGGYFFDQQWFYDLPNQRLPGSPIGEYIMAHIKLDIYHLSDSELVTYMGPIITKMTANPAFASLAARVTATAALVTTFSGADADYLASVHTTEQKLTLRTNARAALEAGARDLAAGAEGLTHDAATLQGGGWDVRADATPVGTLPVPENVSASVADHSGSMDLDWDAIRRGVQTYVAEYATSPAGPWTQGYIGRPSKCEIPGLTPGTLYYFRVKAVGAAGPSGWSSTIEKRAG